MIVKVKAEPLGQIVQTKKGGFIRRVLIADGAGGREVVTVYAKERVRLESLNANTESQLQTGDFFFLV